MKKGVSLLFLIIAFLLFLTAGIFYVKTSRLEEEKNSLNISIKKEITKNKELKSEYYEAVNFDRIYSYATKKLKMVPPSSYIVTEMNDGK